MRRTVTCVIGAVRAALNQVLVATVLGGWQLVSAAVPAATPASGGTASRVLHFPPARSLGMLFVLDAGTQRQIEDYFYWIDGTEMKWEYLGEATGEVVVTRGKRVRLALNKTAGNDLGPLSNLAPDDLYGLRLGQTSDDGCLAHVTHLTGLRVLEFPRSYSDEVKLPVFTPGGLKQLDTLKSLERLSRAHNLSLVLKTLHDGEVDKAARELDRLLCWDILRAGADLASADARTRAWTGDMFRRIARTRPKTEEGAPDTVEARAPAQRILERASRAN